ncbi:MAG: Smr/MutS family protein [Bdellovibrionota bacterium]
MKTAFEKTLEVLEWPEWLRTIDEVAQSPMGRDFIASLVPGMWNAGVNQSYSRSIVELVTFLSEQQALPLTDLKDLSQLYKRMFRGGAISVSEFADLIRNQKGVLSLKAVLASCKCDELKKNFQNLDPLRDWCDMHFPLLDQHGEIADSASDDLRALRMLLKDLKKRIDEKLKEYMNDPHLGEILREDYVTIRDGRYVLPIKNNFKSRMPGIIHDVSKTESTFFIEPQAVVDLNNQLKVAEREIEIEIERILGEVVYRSKEVISFFELNQQHLALADYLQSCAKIISRWDRFCIAEESDSLSFDDLAHPLLSLQGKVVPNSLTWGEALILSGPNTGGKTVLLKSVGLALLFARAGIPVCANVAKVPASIKKVFAEMGDDQNLFEKLSTFSAHVSSLSRILKEAQRGDLVLIDEIATGTAPEEGQALARALLESFLFHGVRAFVTTHYGALKIMALADERCRVASMTYDTAKRLPLYKIVMDIPGESSALDAAERLGIPRDVLDRAKQLLGDDSKDLTKALKNLERSRKHFEDKLLESEEIKKRLQQKEKETARLRELAEEKLKELGREEAKELLKEFRNLKEQLSAKMLSLESGGEATEIFEKVSEESSKLRAIVREDAPFVPTKRGVMPEELKKGVVVEVAGLGLAQVEEDFTAATSGKSFLVVKVGEIKTRVGLDRVFEATREERNRFEQGRKSWLNVEKRKSTAALAEPKSQAGSFVCDVRGRSWEESRRKIDTALNQLTAGDYSSITIVHGHGTEVLKEKIRSYLKKERGEFKYRTGSWPGEGGDGVTIVETDR